MADNKRPNPFAGVAKRAGQVGEAARKHGANAKAIVKSGGAAVARATPEPVRKTVRYTWNAAKEPLGSVAKHELVRLGGHGGAYTLDAMLPRARALGGWIRPSLGLMAVSFGLAWATGGAWRVAFRQSGQGALHHYFARALDSIHAWINPGAAATGMGVSGADAGEQRTDY
jgi:hypothetical protein